MRFEIGQKVWCPVYNMSETWVECPDCGGTGRLRVTFHDETQVSIDCANCANGYLPPTGRVKYYSKEPRAELLTITGVEISGGCTKWRSGTDTSWRSFNDDELFDAEADALAYATALAEEDNKAQQARVLQKEKDTRSWAWNASYHRKCLKRAQHDIEYHTAKLNVAALKAKGQKHTQGASHAR